MKQGAWPIWVISLPVATERRAIMAQQLKEARLEFAFIDAIDGRKGLPPEQEAKVDRGATIARDGYGMRDGEYACALSHQIAYARILEQGLEGAVVLEDDAILTSAFVDFYRGQHYRKADFIQLFCFAARLWRGPGRPLLPNVRMSRLGMNASMAVGYSLSARAARQLRDAGNPVSARADWPMDVTKLGAYVTVPSIIGHPEPGTDTSYVNDGSPDVAHSSPDSAAGHNRGRKSLLRRLLSPSSWMNRIKYRVMMREIEPGFEWAD